MNRFFSFLALSMAMTVSCRISKVGKDQPEQNKAGEDAGVNASKPVVQPVQQQGVYSQTLVVNLDDAGQVKEKMALRLDYFAPSKPGGVSVPSCYDSITGHLVIGRLACAANLDLMVDVQANQLDQVCHTGGVASTTNAATSSVTLPGCKGPANFRVYKFDPQVKVDIIQ